MTHTHWHAVLPVLASSLFVAAAQAQVTPDRTYYGIDRAVPMTVKVPADIKGEETGEGATDALERSDALQLLSYAFQYMALEGVERIVDLGQLHGAEASVLQREADAIEGLREPFVDAGALPRVELRFLRGPQGRR